MSGEFKQMRESRGAASRELDQRLAGDGMGDAGYDEMIAARAVDAGRSYLLSMSGPLHLRGSALVDPEQDADGPAEKGADRQIADMSEEKGTFLPLRKLPTAAAFHRFR